MSQIHMSQNPVSCPFANETKSQRLQIYGFKASLLRFVQIHQICAENRPKSRGKIWSETKKFSIFVLCLGCITKTHNERLERTHAAFRKNTASNQEERSRQYSPR